MEMTNIRSIPDGLASWRQMTSNKFGLSGPEEKTKKHKQMPEARHKVTGWAEPEGIAQSDWFENYSMMVKNKNKSDHLLAQQEDS